MIKFENYLKRVGGFKQAILARKKKIREENEKVTDKKIAEVTKIVIDEKEDKVNPGATTLLVKLRQPPLLIGQKFDRWRIEVEKWHDNNKAPDEEKYIDLLEIL